jgi:hypothetical protein
MIRCIYRLLTALNWLNAILRGPGAVMRRAGRVAGYRAIGRLLR